ncbi:MAG: WG repeat-containing protein [Chitinophagaceae bacterium]|nr:WG repeat-containing protein [Chitinophagaceae bacterium]
MPACFSEGLCGLKKDGKYGYINKAKEVVIPFQYLTAYSFTAGYARATKMTADRMDWRAGFINKSGKEMTPFEYKSTSDFTEGMALVEKDSKVGYYDLNFKMPIPIQYDNGRSFSQGLAAVNKGATGSESWSKKGGKWGFFVIKLVPCYDPILFMMKHFLSGKWKG